MNIEIINLNLANLLETPANHSPGSPENRLSQKNNPCTEKMTPVRKKNSPYRKNVLLPEKLTPVPGKKSPFFVKKLPGNTNFKPEPAKKWSAPGKNRREAKNVAPVQMRKRAVPEKNSLYAKKVVCTGKKSPVRTKSRREAKKIKWNPEKIHGR